MKFSHNLRFNIVADWSNEYIAYAALKRQISNFEKKQQLQVTDETTPLIARTRSPYDRFFTSLLDRELYKVATFYESQEKELFLHLDEIEEEIQRLGAQFFHYGHKANPNIDHIGMSMPLDKPRRKHISNTTKSSQTRIQHPPSSSNQYGSGHKPLAYQDETVDSITSPLPRFPRRQQSEASLIGGSPLVWDMRVVYKRKLTKLYVSLMSLNLYVKLNYSGFRKILKKYDKVACSQLKVVYLSHVVDRAYPFTSQTRLTLNDKIKRIIALYAICITNGDVCNGHIQLQLYRCEQVAWEKDVMWKKLMDQDRRGGKSSYIKSFSKLYPTAIGPPDHAVTNPPIFRLFKTIQDYKGKVLILLAVGAFVVLLMGNFVPGGGVEANNCFAILTFATILWATEPIPLFVTSLLVPLLLIVFRTIRSESEKDQRLSTPDATKFIFSVMFPPTIMLLIGGFTIASALSKSNLDRILVTRVLGMVNRRPRNVILAFMGVACFSSMWISNVAVPALCFSLIKPVLKRLPPKTTFAPCLIMGIALAANIGGQSSPISSPQNLIALQYMDPPLGWLQWFAAAIPVSLISILLIWLLLLLVFRPGTTANGEALEIPTMQKSQENLTKEQGLVAAVCVATILLWCIERQIEDYVGDMGVIALLPIVIFYSSGILKKDDFEQYPWATVFLAMGGIALGKAVDSSGLLSVMADLIRDLIQDLSLSIVVLALSAIVMVISTFISHTVASVLLVPIVAEVGANFPDPHPRLLIFITALICSTGMGMPVSGFPNQSAANQVDEQGNVYLTNVDFLKSGVPASVVAALTVATIGYMLMRLIGL